MDNLIWAIFPFFKSCEIPFKGALKLNEKCVKDVMTQINYVFTVCEDAIIDYDFMQKITEAGYSRIPVTKKTDNNGAGDITGLLPFKCFLIHLTFLHFLRF